MAQRGHETWPAEVETPYESDTAPEIAAPNSAAREANNFAVASEYCQEFLQYALEDLGQDCMVLSFLPLPWRMRRQHPERLFAPQPGTLDVDPMVMERFARYTQIILMVHVVGDVHEREASERILKPLRNYKQWITRFIAFVVPPGLAPENEVGDALTAFSDELMAADLVDDIIIDPQREPGMLDHHVHRACKTHRYMMRRTVRTLQSEPLQMPPQEVRQLASFQQRLLWEETPKLLMVNFPPLNRRLNEHNHGVGPYRFLRRFQTHSGVVLMGTLEDDLPVAVKVITKSTVDSPDALEPINREIRFLRESILVHPNVATGRDVLHTENYLYIILDHHGSQNLEQYCCTCPQSRLPENEVKNCLLQLSNALGFMHHLNVSHRQVSAHHVVVKRQGQELPHYTLVDFRSTVIAKVNELSDSFCGSLPSMAPEVVTGQGYIPQFVDRWCTGIVLLEITGGITSLQTSVRLNWNEEDLDLEDCMRTIERFFHSEGSHARALASLHGVSFPEILGYLQDLLQLTPTARMPLKNIHRKLRGIVESPEVELSETTAA